MLLKQVPYMLNSFCISCLDLVCVGSSWFGFPQICSHISFWETYSFKLPFGVAWHDCVNFEAVKNFYVSMAFNLILCHMLICCEVGLEYHSDTTEKCLHTTCPWQVRLIIVVELVDHLHFGSCFELPFLLPRICFDLTFICLPCILWILLLYSKFALCFLALGKAMIPFLCTYIQKSYFLIMHYPWGSYPTLSRTPFFKCNIL